MAAPFDLVIRYTDGPAATMHETPAVWQADQKTVRIPIATSRVIRSLDIAGGIWVDADSTNNGWIAK